MKVTKIAGSTVCKSAICFALVLLCSSALFTLCGCGVIEYLWPEGPPHDDRLYESYDQTLIKLSSPAEVLTTIHKPEYELLSQGKSVVASVGEKGKGRKLWLNMVAFDEDMGTAKRKYIVIVDDKLNPMEESRKSLSFDCEVVLKGGVLDEPYANENARRIAILRYIKENAHNDTNEVGSDNKTLNTCGLLINQALHAVLSKLDPSPALASRLSESAGVEFSHMSFGRGKIQMLVEKNVAKVKVRLGQLVKRFEKPRHKEGEDSEEK